jgi:hypothetical protein
LVNVVGVVFPASVVCAVAVTVPAPEAVEALSVTEATPFASVSAVPVVGSNTPNNGLVVKVTTAPTIGVPVADLNVAVTLAGLLAAMEVRGAELVSSVSATVSVGEPSVEDTV